MDLQVYINASLSDGYFTNFSSDNETQRFLYSEDVHYPYYGDYLAKLRAGYGYVHGYLSFAFCVFGITANVLNVIVLTRKIMLSPTNAILTGLAMADMLVMVSYLPFTYHNYIRTDIPETEKFSYGWAVFTLFHAHFTIVFHTISTWLTVTVAIWRFLAVSFPQNTTVWCNMRRAKYAIFFTYMMSAIFCIPAYLTFSIFSFQDKEGQVVYIVNFSDIAKRHNNLLKNMNFWIFSVITKLVPCVALTGISLGLIRILYERNQRRKRLKRNQDHDRTTQMLLAVLLLFLLTEFPSGLLALLSGILGSEFFENVYVNFGDIMDALALINSAINFIIYCSMSQQFRNTFANLFFPNCVKNVTNGTVTSV
ncbi:G-protein coupled receptor dmsr-1 isoform X1 [Parasteatoda tepidariorum]|uniref:G-protein coupled receptor dmsr-1 isoform X1 n=1 Tax=Parasteatoda tepidariorum TaxID=114398 RepID=UPI001C7272F5|nr:G-protein coupled receptor dmsr-1-like [Parasteatoda tepidariorum]